MTDAARPRNCQISNLLSRLQLSAMEAGFWYEPIGAMKVRLRLLAAFIASLTVPCKRPPYSNLRL
jgi:hypothetical protein